MSTDDHIRDGGRPPGGVSVVLAPATGETLRRLATRVLVLASSEAEATAPFIDQRTSGLIITGADAVATVRKLHAQHPGLTLLVEPESVKTFATAERPFILEQDLNAMFAPDLADVLDAQTTSGAAAAVLPAGVVDADDSAALKAIIRAANAVERDDLILPLFIHFRWAIEPNVTQLIAIAKRSRHPVAIALVDSTSDPLSHSGAPAGYRRIFTEVPQAMPWRADLGAFDALAHGAFAAAVGQLPSLRRVALPGATSRSSKPSEHTPHIFIPALARYSRSAHMQEAWFASAEPYTCLCQHCRGRAIDRFNSSAEQRLEGHLHNLDRITDWRDQIDGFSVDQIRAWWRTRLTDAEYEHEALVGRTGVSVDIPPVVKTWISLG